MSSFPVIIKSFGYSPFKYFPTNLITLYIIRSHLYNYISNLQVNAEFKFMFGDDTLEKIIANWNKILPAVLKFGGEKVPNVFTTYKAIEIIDKAFHSSGTMAKSDPAFVIYEVKL